jgi:hypothetical protein
MSFWTKIRDTVTAPFRAVSNIVAGGLLGRGRAPEIKVTNPAPAVAAPEPTVGQEATDLVAKKKRVGTKGKRSLMIDTGANSSSGGSTGTGLNL